MTGKRRKPKGKEIGEQFVPRPADMLSSPALQVLTLAARRILDRLEAEHAEHAGTKNGKLPCTYSNFVEAGVDRKAIAQELRVLAALGFIEITVVGHYAGPDKDSNPSRYRLTYLRTADDYATNDWREVRTLEEAKGVVAAVRNTRASRRKTDRSPSQKGNSGSRPDA